MRLGSSLSNSLDLETIVLPFNNSFDLDRPSESLELGFASEESLYIRNVL